MSDDPIFDRAVADVLRHEGGLSDNPRDPGKLTNFGFALAENPDLTPQQICSMTRDQAIARYRAKWWDPMNWRNLPPDIAVKTFDIAVDQGTPAAVRALQRACRACGTTIQDDGKLGPGTIAAANQVPVVPLLAALKSELAAIYRMIAEVRKIEQGFLAGWLNRAYE